MVGPPSEPKFRWRFFIRKEEDVLIRIVFVSLLALALTSCTTGTKKQKREPQIANYESATRTYSQEASSWEYDNTDSLKPYGRPTEKKYSAPVQLSAKQIQQALKNADFYRGEIDGKIGPKTKEAIIKFQKAHGLKPDGIAGKGTSAELSRYLSK